MAFRGVGGKKPDEGRGDWAQRNLIAETDPSSINKLASQVHGGSNELAFFWINQILEAQYGIDHFEQSIEKIVYPDGRVEAYEGVAGLRQLALERGKFEHLCDEFRSFLREHSVNILPYCAVFDLHQVGDLTGGSVSVSPGGLDGFIRDTALPSEDFEIVYAALRLPADIFVTDDERLIRCAMSLGLNFHLGPTAFCKGSDYAAKLQAMSEWADEVISQDRRNESGQH